MNEIANIEDIKQMKSKIKNGFSLCNFLGNCESEVMVAQTIHACVLNNDKHGEPFSFRGDGVFMVGGAVNNAKAYNQLLRKSLFVEDERQGKVVIFPTQLLIDKLKIYFTEKDIAKAKKEG